jgi:hypothetical protein
MSEIVPGNASVPAATSRGWILAVVVLACVGGLGYVAWSENQRARKEAEKVATYEACRMMSRVVAVYAAANRGEWPKMWDSLKMAAIQDNYAREGAMKHWEVFRDDMARRVRIDFHADPKAIARQTPETFTAMSPIGEVSESPTKHWQHVIDAVKPYYPAPVETN